MLKKSKKSGKGIVVTEAEHKKWHKKHGCCGSKKEHDACMKKWGITIKGKRSSTRKKK
ncbi:MAG: hypothetical protein NT136_02575 [Candidatus Moranbacteria bacterium]|nr:hypothetical protein [Candidatus Moranbacteria bacterium]